MSTLLIDTGALFALVDADDNYHAEAVEFIQHQKGAFTLLLTDTILIESMTLIKSRLGQDTAMRTMNHLHQSPRFQLNRLTSKEWLDTWAIFEKYADKAWSPFDCSCLAVAANRNLYQIFAFDDHFRQMAGIGLRCVP